MSDDKKEDKPSWRTEALSLASAPSDVRAGDIRIRSGALPSGLPTPSGATNDHGGNIIFELGTGGEVVRFSPNGKVYVRGELVEDNLEIWSGLRDWLVAAGVIKTPPSKAS